MPAFGRIVKTKLFDDNSLLIDQDEIMMITSPIETSEVCEFRKRTHVSSLMVRRWKRHPVMRYPSTVALVGRSSLKRLDRNNCRSRFAFRSPRGIGGA